MDDINVLILLKTCGLDDLYERDGCLSYFRRQSVKDFKCFTRYLKEWKYLIVVLCHISEYYTCICPQSCQVIGLRKSGTIHFLVHNGHAGLKFGRMGWALQTKTCFVCLQMIDT